MIHELLVVNASAQLATPDFQRVVAAVQRQIAGDFAPHWNTSLVLHAARPEDVKSSDWAVFVSDKDSNEYLGEHHLDGVPRGVVLLGACKSDGVTWSSTLSHEILELAGDPPASLAAETADGTFYAWEASDPVEAQNYDLDGIEVSNFVLPLAFFHGYGSRYDYRSVLTAPRTVAPGGYQLVRRPGEQWSQINGSRVRAAKTAPARWTRRGQRMERV